MTSKGKDRELPGFAPPMRPYMGAQGKGVSGRDVAGMQSTYSTGAVEGDDNNYNEDNDNNDEGRENPINVEQMYDVDEIGSVGNFKSIAWWTAHHSHDRGLALVREFQLVVQEVLIMKGFPSFRKGSKKEVDLGELLDLARQNFVKKNPDKRVLHQS